MIVLLRFLVLIDLTPLPWRLARPFTPVGAARRSFPHGDLHHRL